MIYLDNNATTQVAPEVFEAMLPFLREFYGNSSSQHFFGKHINNAVKQARCQVAELIDCEPIDIVFTSGATEAINLAIKGVAESYQHKGNHIITAQTEHAAVLDVCRFLEARGFEVTYLPVSRDGHIKLDDIKDALRADTILVTIMAANNETGVLHPIRQIANLTHEAGAFFMTDATQAVGKVPLSVEELDVDLLAFSAHKFYGPKGVGGLFVRQRSPRRVTLEAILHGGGHERGLRSGTLNVPGIVGLGKACQLARDFMSKDAEHILNLRDYLEASLLEIEGTYVNGLHANRLYNVTNLGFKGIDSNVLIGQLETIALSNGSACSSALFQPSHVLKAMGLTDEQAFSAIRFSIGRYNTFDEMHETARLIKLHHGLMYQL